MMQYADRLPIGLESVIRNVPAESVKAFYDRWYRPENMALVCAASDPTSGRPTPSHMQYLIWGNSGLKPYLAQVRVAHRHLQG